MNRYSAKTLADIRAARVQLIAGLENPRVDAVTKERMRVWITEAETELVSRFGEGIAATVNVPVAKQEAPKLWEMKAGIRVPQDAHDREKLAWSAWS